MDEEISQELENEKEEQDGKSISSDLIRGHINTIILRSLCDGDKYGYEIIAEIERKSHGQYSLKQPSLYSALKRLEKEGYVTSYWGGSVGGGRRKYFSLTDEGRGIAEQNQSEWEYSRTIIDSLISDRDFDFSNPAPTLVNMRVLRSSTSRVPTGSDGGEESFEFEPSFTDGEYERRNEELATRSAELERERIALDEARLRFEEEMREREEALRMENVEKEREFAAREEALRLENEEKERIIIEREEILRSENEEKIRELVAREEAIRLENEEKERIITERERILDEERREAILAESGVAEAERAEYNARLREQEDLRAAEQARYETLLLEQRELMAAEQIAHQHELEEQARRIREEQEILFRKREQELIHQNYLNLVNAPAERPEPSEYSYISSPADENPEAENDDYRAILQDIYDSSPSGDAGEPAKAPRAQAVDGVDFYDLEDRAARDGIRLVTVGGKPAAVAEPERSTSVVHKGKALFLAAIVTFFYLVTLGGVTIGIQSKYALPLFFPYFIWGVAVALLLVTGLAYANRFGERALRKKSLALINSIVIFVLTVIVTLIVALAVPIDFNSASACTTFLTIPIFFLFAIVIFGSIYYVQIRPQNK